MATNNGSVNGTNGTPNGSMVSSESPVRAIQESPAEAKTRDERSTLIVQLATKITTSPTLVRNRIQPEKPGQRVTHEVAEQQPVVKDEAKIKASLKPKADPSASKWHVRVCNTQGGSYGNWFNVASLEDAKLVRNCGKHTSVAIRETLPGGRTKSH